MLPPPLYRPHPNIKTNIYNPPPPFHDLATNRIRYYICNKNKLNMKSLLLYSAFFFCLFTTLVALWLGMAGHSVFYAIGFSSGFCMYLFLEKLKVIE